MSDIQNGLENFGYQEIDQAIVLFTAYRDNSLPENWDDTDVRVDFNTYSGLVFLLNRSYQAAVLDAEHGLAIFHTTPYYGNEGVLANLVDNYMNDVGNWNETDDKDFLLRTIAAESEFWSNKENGEEIVAQFNQATEKLMKEIAESNFDKVIATIKTNNPNFEKQVEDEDWLTGLYDEYAEELFEGVENPSDYQVFKDIGLWFNEKAKEVLSLPAKS